MEQQLANILVKATDYKVCLNCFKINWYENKNCIECNKTKFDNDEKRIISLIESDYDYYKKEGFLENDIDDILMDV